jgi:hypothetical protein
MPRNENITLDINRGGNLRRFIHIVVDAETPEELKLSNEIRGSLNSLNREIEASIRFCERIYQNSTYRASSLGYVHFEHTRSRPDDQGDFNVDEIDNYRVLINISNQKITYQSFFGNENSISHSVFVSSDERTLIDYSEKPNFNQIIQCKILKEIIFAILHDVALDIYSFHFLFDCFLASEDGTVPIDILRAISLSKVDFSSNNNIINEILIDKINFNNLNSSYLCFASFFRSTISYADLDFKAYCRTWLNFKEFFYSEELHELNSADRNRTINESAEIIINFILDLHRFGGQISARKLDRKISEIIENSEINSNKPRSLLFVVTNKRPKDIRDRNKVARAFGRRRWRQNLWIISSDSSNSRIQYFAALFPYVRLVRIEIPQFTG